MFFLASALIPGELQKAEYEEWERIAVEAVTPHYYVSPKTLAVMIETIPALIVRKAQEHGVDPNVALKVASCESGYNPRAVGDTAKGGSYGLWQIHSPSHPTVTREQAFDPYWATEWAMPKLKITPFIWTCYRTHFL